MLSKKLLLAPVGMAAFCVACSDDTLPESSEISLSKDGMVVVGGAEIPYSSFASNESREWLVERVAGPNYGSALSFRAPGPELDAYRRNKDEKFYKPLLDKQLARYPSKIEEAELGELRVFVVEPEAGVAPENENKLLINLHGGSYVEGAGYAQQIEAVPIAAMTRMRVVSIDYPLAPEYSYPYAVGQIINAYRELLKTYDSTAIGMFGCSAGGALIGQVAAHLVHDEIRLPGALAVLCDGWGAPFGSGDGAHTSHLLSGRLAPELISDINAQLDRVVYFKEVASNDPLAFPMTSKEIYANFPPTMFVTGTRSHEVSNALEAHINLSLAGVESELFIWDGQEHLFLYNSNLPEAREAYKVIGDFFTSTLK